MLLSIAVFVIPVVSLAAWFRLRETHIKVEEVYRVAFGADQAPFDGLPGFPADLTALASATPEVAFTRSLIALSQVAPRIPAETPASFRPDLLVRS
jgi:hypothetical protein